MKKLTFIFSTLTAFSFLAASNAFAAVQGDGDYLIAQTPNGAIIYAKNLQAEAEGAAAQLAALQKSYDRSFGYPLSSPPILALLSDQNQIANAYAEAAPFLQMTYFGGGARQIDYFGYANWTAMLLAHEGAHLYQLDAKSDFPAALQSVFGRNESPILAGVLPLWTLPNVFLPDLLLEGNAVFNESRITGEGRLYGGRHKALFMALLKSGKLDAARLINNIRDFPRTEEKYIVGGFFADYLARRFGAKAANGFFASHGRRWINPFWISKSFRERFGYDLETLLNDFLRESLAAANEFKLQSGKRIATSQIYAPLGGGAGEILIYSSDGETSGDIIRFDRASRETSATKGHFFAGRPFCGEFGCATTAEGYAATNAIKTGLFDSRRRPIDGFVGEIPQDFYRDRKLYFKTDASFSEAILFDGDRRIGAVASNARYGADGAIYSVRYDRGARRFFRDETELFAIDSEAALCDILPKGSVLFAAPTKRGNGLFIWQNNRVMRLGDADNIIDARYVGGGDFLVAVVTAEGYETLLTSFSASAETPTKPPIAAGAAPLEAIAPKPLEAKPYYAIANLGFTNAYPSLGYDSENGAQGSLTANFSDPLAFNSLSIAGGKTDEGYGQIAYENARYRLFWGGGAYYEGGDKAAWERDYGAEAHAGFLLYRGSTDSAALTLSKQWNRDDKDDAPLIAALKYDFAMSQPYAYMPAYAARFAAYARQNSRDESDETTYKAAIELETRLIGQSFLTIGGSYAKSNEARIVVRDDAKYPIDPVNYALGNLDYAWRADRAIGYYAELAARIDAPIYLYKLPISLHAIAPRVRYEKLELGESRFLVEETTYAIELETLLAHRFDVSFEAGLIANDRAKDDRWYFSLKTAL